MCQQINWLIDSLIMPRTPILTLALFENWGYQLCGGHHGQHHHILKVTDYVTKWVKSKTTRDNDKVKVAKFLHENIMSHFGCPKELISDRGTHFINAIIEELTTKIYN